MPLVEAHPKCLLTELKDGSGVLLHLDTKFYYTLNASAVNIWQLLSKGPQSAEALAANLSAVFEVTKEQAEIDVTKVLDMLLSEGLVERR